MKPVIEVYIEELAFHGIAPKDCYRIASAIEKELGQLFVQHATLASLKPGERRAQVYSVDSPPRLADTLVARAVFESISL